MNSSISPNKTHKLILYFQAHQPLRLQAVNFLDLANSPHYFNDELNSSIVRRIAQDCYLPANRLLLALINQHPDIRITFSLSGILIEQLEHHAPEVIDSFKALAETGCVEFLAETYHHSLASLVNGDEFETQILQHAEKMFELFGKRPIVFRNTELIYNNDVGKRVSMMGYRGIFTEGHESKIGGTNPHQLYCHPEDSNLKIFLRNYRLSDDIAFRFMEGGQPLDVKRYLSWLSDMPESDKLVTLAMDYETFGEHQKASSGIFQFLEGFLKELTRSSKFAMVCPSEIVNEENKSAPLSLPNTISWGDLERDISAWLGNEMQKDAFNSIMKLESDVKLINNQRLLLYWRYLQTSDHFYYMSIKTDSDGSVHAYFSPYASSYDAFINYMNVVTHFTYRLQRAKEEPVRDDHNLAGQEAQRQDVKAATPVWVQQLESIPQSIS